MVNSVDTEKRELTARVATLELLVVDLIDVLWSVDPGAMEAVSRAAAHDLDIQHTHFMPAGAEHQRERLFAVLRNRQLKLDRRRAPRQASAKAAAK